MNKRNNKTISSINRVTDVNIRKTMINKNMKVNNNTNKDVKIITKLKLELDEAAHNSPCPGCKHDIEQLAKFISAKLDSIEKRSNIDKETTNALREVDYINELTDIAILFSKFIKPFTRISKVPDVYKEVLQKDIKANKNVKEHLLKANKLTMGLVDTDMQFKMVSEVLKAFIRATEFKLNVDPYTFYLFDKTIKLGYKTRLLSITSKVVVGIKRIVNPSRYKW